MISTSVFLSILVQTQSAQKVPSLEIEKVVAQSSLDSRSSTSILVQRNGKEIYFKEFGKAGKPLRYRIGSLTKQFTAGLIVQLDRERKLNLSDPITKWLPDVPSNWKSITVLQLLTHSSGIANMTELPRFIGVQMNPTTPEGILQFVAREPMVFTPGTQFAYNNSGYCLLGLIAEKVEKKPYFKQLEDRFFKPLGMRDTGEEENLPTIKGLTKDGGEPSEISMTWPYSAGAIISSPRDLAKWDNALGGNKIFSEAEKKLLWTPSEQTKTTLTPYGLGWVLRMANGKLIGVAHAGSIDGFSSFIVRSMVGGTSVIVLANKEDVDVGTLGTSILRAVEPEYSKAVKSTAAPQIPDANIDRTKEDRKLLDSILDGTLTENLFDSEFLKRVPLKNILDTGSVLGRRGSIKSFELVQEQNSMRSYRVNLGNETMRFSVAKNPDGKIIGMQLRPE